MADDTELLLKHVTEFLHFLGLTATVEALEVEKYRRGDSLPSSAGATALTAEERAALCDAMLSAFDEGRRDAFLETWNKYVPASVLGADRYAQKIEFHMHVYFAVFPILPAALGATSRLGLAQRMKTFKHYLESRGAALASTPEFLPYYALPYVTQPDQHPSFQGLFNDTWAQDMRATLQMFLDSVPEHGSTAPKLYKMYELYKRGTVVDGSRERPYSGLLRGREGLLSESLTLQGSWGGKQGGGSGVGDGGGGTDDTAARDSSPGRHSTYTVTPGAAGVATMAADGEGAWQSATGPLGGPRIGTASPMGPTTSQESDPFVDVGDSDVDPTSPSAMVATPGALSYGGGASPSGAVHDEDGMGATPLLVASSSPAGGEGDVPPPGESVSPGGLADAEGAAVAGHDDGAAALTPEGAVAAQQQQQQQPDESYHVMGMLAPLDYAAIKRDLVSGSDALAARLLQALRWRYAKSEPGPDRFAVLATWIEHDLLACMEPSAAGSIPTTCLERKSVLVAEELACLLNAVASDRMGRAYLLNPSGKVLDSLYAMLTSGWAKPPAQKTSRVGSGSAAGAGGGAAAAVVVSGDVVKDSVLQQQALAALQKLSLKRKAQSALIKLNLIPWICEHLKDPDSLSEYTLEYGMALLMNLVLRTAGKVACEAPWVSEPLLQVCENLIESPNQQVRTYVNGTCYSILERPAVREKARTRGMEDLLKAVAAASSATFASQIDHILAQLQSDAPAQPGDASDDEAEVDGDAYYEDDGYGEADEVEESELHSAASAAGEALLCRGYLAPLEEAQQEARLRASMAMSMMGGVLEGGQEFWSPYQPAAGLRSSYGMLGPNGHAAAGGGGSILDAAFRGSGPAPLARPATPGGYSDGRRSIASRPASARPPSGRPRMLSARTQQAAKQQALQQRGQQEALRLKAVKMGDGKTVALNAEDFVQAFGAKNALPRTPPSHWK